MDEWQRVPFQQLPYWLVPPVLIHGGGILHCDRASNSSTPLLARFPRHFSKIEATLTSD
jgi:hypothetical protein